MVKNNKVISLDTKEKQVAKGTKKAVKKRFLQHKHFLDVMENLSKVYIKQNTIQSREHQVHSVHQTRVSLTAFDTKRWIEDDGVHTLAHGHYKIINQ